MAPVRVTKVQIVSEDSLYLEFDDGANGIFRIKDHLTFERSIERELLDRATFHSVKLNEIFGFIEWENGYDISA